jgi:hypothetical protein
MIYEISSFTGLSDYEDKGIKGAFKFGANLDVRKAVDSLSANQALIDEGFYTSTSPSVSISPSSSVSRSFSPSPSPSESPSTGESHSPSTTKSPSPSLSPSATKSYSPSPSPSPSGGATTVFKDLIRFFVKCSDGYTYGFGSLGYIYRRDSDGFWMQVYKDANGAIKGAEEKPSSSKKKYLYWATDQTLKRKEIPGKNHWNDVETVNSNLESADWHTMKQIGGALKICNRDMLGLVGYDDSYTNEALDLIPGNLSKTLVDRNGYSIVGSYKASDPDNGINSAIDAEYPLIQVGNNGYVYFANFSDSVAVKRFPGGGKTNPGGVCNEIESPQLFSWEETALSWIDKQSVGNMALFAVYGADAGRGGIYSYGRRNKNKPFVMNLEYQLDADELGALCNVNGTTLVSYQDGTDYGVKAVDLDTKADAIYEGLDLKSKIKTPSNITTWTIAELFMKPLPENTSVQFWYKINKTGDFVQAKLGNGNTNFTTTSGKKAVFLIQNEGEIFEPKVMTYSYGNTTPEIYRMRINFQ